MRSHALVRRPVELVRSWLGFHGCGTSLLYWAPRSQNRGRSCAVVWTRRITCTDAVARRARVGRCGTSLLHDCCTGAGGVDMEV
jgi:hypothetical protein